MSFISNASHVTLGEGVYNNIGGNLNNIVNNWHFYGRKRRLEIEGKAPVAQRNDMSHPSDLFRQMPQIRGRRKNPCVNVGGARRKMRLRSVEAMSRGEPAG